MKRFEILQSAEPNTLDMYIYGDIEGDRYDWWRDEEIESKTSANYVRDELSKYAGIAQLNIYINSYGGSVYEGTAIYNQLKRYPAHKTVYIDGFACSIASVIAMAGDEVIMPRNTLMMIHNMWMYCEGNASELRKAADDLDVINAAGRQAYLEKAGEKITEDELIRMMDEETWLTAEDCIRYGFADRYAEEDVDMTASREILQKVNFRLEQHIEIQKNLAAQLRELTRRSEPGINPEQKEEKTETPEPLTLMKVLGGFFMKGED
jgi:ATP-dependent protease ClpP protease subunit